MLMVQLPSPLVHTANNENLGRSLGMRQLRLPQFQRFIVCDKSGVPDNKIAAEDMHHLFQLGPLSVDSKFTTTEHFYEARIYLPQT